MKIRCAILFLLSAVSLMQGAVTNLTVVVNPAETFVWKAGSKMEIRAEWSATPNAQGFILVNWLSSEDATAEPVFSMLMTASGHMKFLQPNETVTPADLSALGSTVARTYTTTTYVFPSANATRLTVDSNAPSRDATLWPFALPTRELTGHAEIYLSGSGLNLTLFEAQIRTSQTLFMVR